MVAPHSLVIIGGSLAGAGAAATLRAEGFDGRLVVVADEPVLPYERPLLSKEYLRSEAGLDKVFIHDADFYDDHQIELRLSTTAVGVDASDRTIELDSGERLDYDGLLLATGASPRRLDLPGGDLQGVHYLRTVGDADRLSAAIRASHRVVVIGAGWIGCEVAASARQMGAEVAIVETSELPLLQVLGPEVAAFYRDVHAEHGVRMHLGAATDSIRGAARVEEVRLRDGRTLGADVVVVGVGVAPRLELAEQAGLALENGIVTDQYLSASAPGVFAAGDVAAAWHPILDRRIRLEHWSSALNQGPAAGRNMLGMAIPYTKIPYFYSDQYEISMEYSGFSNDWDQVLFRGDPSSREFMVFWVKNGVVDAGMNVNTWGVADTIATLVASRHPLDLDRLADPEVELISLLSSAG
jgi:3-phenylpropionate/trans-cinnamate dioxygenase ferredoxin reductase subunit